MTDMNPSIATQPSAALRIVELDPTDDPRWDAFVESHPAATVFHHSGWIRSLEREYGQRTLAFGCEDAAGRLCGVLPMMATRGIPLQIGGPAAGPRLSSLPRTPMAGPIAADRAGMTALTKAAIERASAMALRLQLKQRDRSLDGTDERLVGAAWRLNYVRALPQSPDDLRFGSSRNNARIRWAVGKAEREGIRVRPAETAGELREWYRLYLDANRWHGQPSRPFRLFESIWEHLRPKGFMRLLLAERQSGGRAEILSGSVLMMLSDTVHYMFNGRRREALSLRPNDILQWHAMRDASAAGFRRYDFGEVEEENVGLAEFKSKWGTDAERLYRYHSPPLEEIESGYGALESRGTLRRAAQAIWRRVPLRITAFAGERLYRYL